MIVDGDYEINNITEEEALEEDIFMFKNVLNEDCIPYMANCKIITFENCNKDFMSKSIQRKYSPKLERAYIWSKPNYYMENRFPFISFTTLNKYSKFFNNRMFVDFVDDDTELVMYSDYDDTWCVKVLYMTCVSVLAISSLYSLFS